MNKIETGTDLPGRIRHRKIARKTSAQFIGAVCAFELGYILLNLFFLIIMGVTGLDRTFLFNAFKPFMIPVMLIVSFVGCSYIAYRFIRRPLEYLDDVSKASKKLAHPTEEPIVLPQNLKSIEDELNTAREQALMDMNNAHSSERKRDDQLVCLAHDLRTPLTSILGYLRLIEDEPDIPRNLALKYTGIAREKAERLEELLGEFYDITRFSSEGLVLDPAPVNISGMLSHIAKDFIPVLADKRLNWQLHIQEDVWIVCDKDKLERAVDNLIRNAVNYSYENTDLVFTLTGEHDKIQISLQNRGPEIPKEKLDRIFDRFYRLDSARSSDTGGAGLGLAIAKEVTELHQGTICASSKQDVITFTICLPSDCKKIV